MAENWCNSEHIHLHSWDGSLKSNSADFIYRGKKEYLSWHYTKNCVGLTLKERKETMFA